MRVASACLLLLSCLVPVAVSRSPFYVRSNVVRHESISNAVLDLRGGSSKARRKGKSSKLSGRTATGKKKVQAAKAEPESGLAASGAAKFYKQIPHMTKFYFTLAIVITVLGVAFGEVAQGLLALDPMRVMYGMEYWRPFTAACFLGPPSLNWVFSGYHLYEYGSSLERAFGTPQQLIFLITQVFSLSILALLLGQPFFGQSVITAMLHVLSRATPTQQVKWLVFPVPFWSLPYCLMAADLLQAKFDLNAAVPHIMGILAGHFYQFHKFVWPKIGGEDWLVAPDFLVRWLDPQAKKDAAKKAVNEALSKSRKRGKGRKLGGSKKKRK